MEYKFQDILKNIIPGFYIVFGISALCFFSNHLTLEDTHYFNKIPGEVSIFFIPLLFYIIGYLNDIISSCFEFHLYERVCKRPSELLLNKKKKRYTLSNQEEIRNKLSITQTILSKDEAYKAFQKANSLKDNTKENISEFYVSYIFARNLMVANIIITIASVIYLFFDFLDYKRWLISIVYILLSVLFIYRWKQKALYYSKKVFNSII